MPRFGFFAISVSIFKKATKTHSHIITMLCQNEMNQNEQLVAEIFGDYGLVAQKIPECDEKSPDFLIQDKGRRYLVELKTKYDSPEIVEEREAALEKPGIYEHHSVLQRTNTMSGIVGDAYEQLKASKKKHNAHECYLFLLAAEPYAHDKYIQFYNTIYGIKLIICLGNSAPLPRYCFYYSFCDFFRYRDIIDGAIISTGRTLRFCLNTFSNAYNSADGNSLAKYFPKYADPMRFEEGGTAYIMNTDIDRRDTEALNAYLEQKYNLERVTQGDFPSITIESRMKLEDD